MSSSMQRASIREAVRKDSAGMLSTRQNDLFSGMTSAGHAYLIRADALLTRFLVVHSIAILWPPSPGDTSKIPSCVSGKESPQPIEPQRSLSGMDFTPLLAWKRNHLYGINRPCSANFQTLQPSAASDTTIIPTPIHRSLVLDSVPVLFLRTFSANSAQSSMISAPPAPLSRRLASNRSIHGASSSPSAAR